MIKCLPTDDILGAASVTPRDKEHELAIAVSQKDFEKVHHLLLQGVNKNGLFKGKTLLSVAASEGDVNTMRVLLETIQETPVEEASSILPPPGNNGYFVVVREGEDDANSSRHRFRTKSEEVTTPEGMADLQWDTELEEISPVPDKVRQVEVDTGNSCSRVDAQDPRGRCALHYAAEAGQLEAVEYLIEAGSKVDLGDRESLTPLHLAAVRGHLDVVKCLLKMKAHVNAKCTDKMTPLHYSASRGHVDIVTTLISHGASVNTLDSGDRTPLKLAASRDLYQVVKVLVESNAKVNIEDVKGYTALCEAVWQKNVAMARLLLEAGAKLTPTPFLLHYAILHRHSEMIELLLEAGAMVNIRDDHGSTPLIVAAVTAQPTIIRLLLKYGAQVDFCGGLSWKTPLLSVLQTDHIPTDLGVILELIMGGADVDKACWDMTPLYATICHNKVDAANLLLRHGASVTTRPGVRSHDPMIIARRIGALPIVQTLVLCGYDLQKNCPEIPKYEPGTIPDPNSVEGWLRIQKFVPLKLSELARIKIRSLWPRRCSMADYVRSLGLPRLLEEYLLISEIQADCSELRGSACKPNFSVFWGFVD
ncbi:hypothetical protein GE061_009751 [Apolygus lucorum]|uniref:Uncharacterized protein n=1 Tax=Apolygus lucorum TaxID=248454 RepID=A0A6A4K5R1_APOLU|nr:hypothetical protein GE061_009751 [Apolygus lucorum]